jgi:hypothetical protein
MSNQADNVLQRLPYRPESFKQEVARYPERLARHREKDALVASRQVHQERDRQHRRACLLRTCDDHAHVRPRRELKSETVKDRRHLGGCSLEDPACLDPSHLLPPHPLDPTEEFCCRSQCFPLWDPRALTECISVPVPVRNRRVAEQAAFKER